MAVPKRRTSRANTRSRRARWKTAAPTLARCPRGHVILPHTACQTCGRYGTRRVLDV